MLLAGLLLLHSHAAFAQTSTWNVTSGTSSWNTAGSWSPSGVVGTGTTALFSSGTGNQVITLNANQAAIGLIFNNTGSTTIRGNSSGTTLRTLTLGTSGITINAGAGAVTLGDTPATTGTVGYIINGIQSWTNNSSNTLTVTGSLAINNGLTIAGSGNTTFTGGNWTGNGGITKSGSGTMAITGNVSSQGVRWSIGDTYGGNFTMQSGTLNVSGITYLTLGENGVAGASYNQTGGTATSSAGSGLYINNGNTATTADFSISGGSFTQSVSTVYVGRGGSGSIGNLNIGGGAGAAIFSGTNINMGANSGATGNINLNSNGVLVTRSVVKGSGTGNLYFDGGTLRADSTTTANSTILSGLTAAQIKNGGASLDTNGVSVSISQALADFSGNTGSLTKTGAGVLTLTGSNSYSGGTTVNTGVLSYGNKNAMPVSGTTTVAAGATLGLGVLTGSAAYFSSTDVDSLFTNTMTNVSMDATSNVGIDTTAGNFSYSVVGSPARGLAKLGTNTLTLSGSNGRTGGTTLWAGTLNYGDLNALGSGTTTFVGNSTLQAGVAGTLTNNVVSNPGVTGTFDTQANAVTLSGIVSGSGSLAKTGAGILTLSGSNSYSGATTVSSGTLAVNSTGAIDVGGSTTVGTATITGTSMLLVDGGTVTFRSSGAGNAGILLGNSTSGGKVTVQNGGSLTINNGALIMGQGAASGNGNNTIDASVFTQTGGTTNLNGGTNYTGNYAPATINISGGTFTATAATFVVGTRANTSLTVSGSAAANFATLQLGSQTSQNYTSTVNLDGGTLAVSSVSNSGSTSATTTFNFNGGTLKARAASAAFLAADAAYVKAGGAIIDDGGFVITIAQPLLNGTGGTGGGSLTKNGFGTLTLAGSNSYTGGTVVNNGVLVFANKNAMPVSGTTTVAAGATLGLGVAGLGYFDVSDVTNLFANTMTNVSLDATSNVAIDTTAGSFLYTNSISGSPTRGLLKLGTNTLTLSGSNTYTGGTTLSGGAINYADVNALGSGTVTFTGNYTLEAGVSGTFGNNVVLNPSVTGTFDTQTYASTLSGIVSGSGALIKTGLGTLTLSGSNSYSGNTTISGTGGTLVAANTSALGASGRIVRINTGGSLEFATDTSANAYVLDMGSGNTGTVIVNRATPDADITQFMGSSTLGNATLNVQAGAKVTSGTATLALSGINLTAGSAGTLTLNPTTATMLVSGSVYIGANNYAKTVGLGGTSAGNEVSGEIANGINTVSVLKTGTSTWTLSGPNTYTGTTNVDQGTLILSGNRTVSPGLINVGGVTGQTGTLNIQGDIPMGGSVLSVGWGNATGQVGTGIVNHSAGVVSFTSGNAVLIGRTTPGVSGTYNLSGGELQTYVSVERGVMIGVNDGASGNLINATFNLSGTGYLNNATGNLEVVRGSGASSYQNSTYNQTGGTSLNGYLVIGGGLKGNGSGFNAAYGANSIANFSVTGGTFSSNTFAGLSRANNVDSNMTIGGTADVTLPAFPITRGSNSLATVYFDGGTLRPLAASTAYMGGLTNAYIKAGGLNLDLASNDITISQNLLTDGTSTGGGLTKAGSGKLTLAGQSTYTGTTSITNGTLVLSGSGSINGSSSITVNGSAAKFVQNSSVAGSSPIVLTQGMLTGNGTVGTVTVGNTTDAYISNDNAVAGAALTLGSLTFQGAATLDLFSNSTAADLIVTGSDGLSTNVAGQVTVNASNAAGFWLTGTYNLISYTGTIGGNGFAGFSQGTITGVNNARQTATLGDSGSAVTLVVSSDFPVWTGLDSGGEWKTGSTGPSQNWKVTSGTTEFMSGDVVMFNDTVTTGTTVVDITAGDVAPAGTIFENSTKNYTLTSSSGYGISNGSLVKSGTGTLTITNTNSYMGGTTLEGGTINVNNAEALGNSSGALTFSGSGGTLQLGGTISSSRNYVLNASGTIDTNGYDLTSSGVISGSGGALVKAGAGTLTLAGSNSYSGGTVINANSGTVSFSTPTGLSSGGVSVGTGSTLQLDASTSVTVANAITGTGVFKLNVSGATANNVRLSGISGFSGTVLVTSTGSTGNKLSMDTADTAVPGSLVIDPGNTLYTYQKNNSFAGGITVSGTGNNENRGAIRVSGTLGGNITLLGDTTIGGMGGLLTGNITSGTTGTQTLGNNSFESGNANFSGAIGGGTGTIALTVSKGTITLSGSSANTYSGLTTISGGALALNKSENVDAIAGDILIGAGALTNGTNQQIADTSTVTMNAASAKWTLGDKSETVANLDMQNAGAGTNAGLVTGSAGKLTVTGTFTHSAGNVTLNSSGTGGQSIINATTVINTGGSWFFGFTDGTQSLVVGAGGLTIGGGSTIAVSATTGSPNFISLDGDVTSVASGTANTISGAGQIKLSGTRTFNIADGAATSDMTVSTIVTDGTAGNGALTKSGPGTLTLSASNSYTGLTDVQAGTLEFAVSETLTGGLTVGTSGTAVLTAHTGAVKVLEITGLTISGTTVFAGGGGKDLGELAPAPVPEPGTIGLLAIGAIGGLLLRRRCSRPL